MIPFISITLFLIFLFISSIHVYWAFGGKWVAMRYYQQKKTIAPKF
ncbi:DUF3995 domain-containing protein [Cellulophaga sp. BC115SP]|nr:DUF3995 domain-containing protein [Cellulophaga sp. BC115SP]